MFVQEGAEHHVSWRQTVRAEVIAASVGVQVLHYPMFVRFVAVVSIAHEGRRQSVYRGRQSVFGYDAAKDRFGARVPRQLSSDLQGSISVVVDDDAALVYFQHGLELGVGDDVHGVRQRVAEMQLYAQVALLYQMEARAIALVGGQIKTEGVAVSVVAASQSVPLVLPHLAGRGKQIHVAPDEEVVFEIRL